MRLILVLSFFFFTLPAHAAPTCADVFRGDIEASQLAHTVQNEIENSPVIKQSFGRRARGLAVISATMVASAALSTHLTNELPKDMVFLSALVGQISTLGIFVLGAPIWQPISSAMHKFAFGLQSDNSPTPSDPALEKLWQQTQARYSQNAQMSRNVIQSFLVAAHANFSTAREAMREGQEGLAISQIAETAVRMRRLFSEIDPRDSSVALAVQATFTRHVTNPETLEAAIVEQIRRDDAEATSTDVAAYYQTLLRTWLRTTN